MSEVLIRMKMPKCCEECRFFAWKRGVGQHCAVDDRITFHATLDGFDVGYERNGDCPLVPVPPHGDLIDRSKLDYAFTALRFNEAGLAHYGDRHDWFLKGVEIEKIIYNAPTIIPASEEGN